MAHRFANEVMPLNGNVVKDEASHSERAQSGVTPTPTWFLALVSVPILLGMLYFGSNFFVPLALAALLFILNIALIGRLDSATIAGRSVPTWLA